MTPTSPLETTPDQPPAFTQLSTAMINDDSMPAAMFRSYARLYAAAWRSGYQETPPLEFDRELVPLLGVHRSQARQQLRMLRFARLLDWSSDGSNRYVIRFNQADRLIKAERFPAAEERGGPPASAVLPDSGVVGVDSFNSDSESIHQQQTQSGLPDGTRQAEQRVLHYLLAAGGWPDVGERLAVQIAFNERRSALQGDQNYLPTTADVLGWMAYCFADGKKNNIGMSAAVLAANLNANRRCPDEYRPAPICAACGLEVDYCQCEQPQEHFPEAFLERAFHGRSPYELDRTWWGVCTRCRGYPCQCQ
jgi:hypothetical protein